MTTPNHTSQPDPGTTDSNPPARRAWHPGAALAADHEFPWALFFAVSAAVLAGHCLFGEVHHLAQGLVPAWVRPVVFAAILIYAALVLHAERLKAALPLSAVVVVSMCLFLLGFDSHLLLAELLPGWALILLSGVAFLWSLRLAHSRRRELERGRSLARMPAHAYIRKHPLRALILTVSKPDARPGDNVETVADGDRRYVRFTSTGKEPVDVRGADIGAAIKQLDGLRPNWQQLLRALRRHCEGDRRLEQVILYGSTDSRLEDCATFLRPFLGKATLRVLPPVNLEDFEEVHRLLSGEVRLLIEEGVRPDHIAVDITGGFKIPSVAGAVLTLNRAVVCQYVQSIGSDAAKRNDLDAQIYDFRWDKSLEMPA